MQRVSGPPRSAGTDRARKLVYHPSCPLLPSSRPCTPLALLPGLVLSPLSPPPPPTPAWPSSLFSTHVKQHDARAFSCRGLPLLLRLKPHDLRGLQSRQPPHRLHVSPSRILLVLLLLLRLLVGVVVDDVVFVGVDSRSRVCLASSPQVWPPSDPPLLGPDDCFRAMPVAMQRLQEWRSLYDRIAARLLAARVLLLGARHDGSLQRPLGDGYNTNNI